MEKRTLQRDIKDLTDAGLINVKYSNTEKAYIHKGKPTGKISFREELSKKKMQHLNRLRRLAGCMQLVDETDPVKSYFAMFEEA